MNKPLLAAAVALSLAGTAAAASDKAFTIEGLNDYSLNVSGIRAGVSLYKPAAGRAFTHELNAGLGYMTSTNKEGNAAPAGAAQEDTMISLTAGYFAHKALTDKLDAFAGARVGLMKAERDAQGAANDQDTTGPIMTIGAGLKFNLTQDTCIRVAYEFGKFLPSDDDKGWGESRGMRTLSVGVGIAF